MAIKELIKTFAMFLGYEMPDSSGQTGTIIDGMEDSMGGFGDAIEDANSGLADTAEKAKKAAEATSRLGFDELHTVSKPSESTDTGSAGGSVGGGAGIIDPKILKALEDWDYMFGNIRMKAMDIRDYLLEMASKLGKLIDENIFQPIKISWDKYGANISSNVKETFNNISHIVSGVFDVVGEKWKPFFQQASDLFFSLVDTASDVSNGISRFLVAVWDNGGKTLFEGVADLATAFLKLATKINDYFVKPLIRWFNDNITPVLGKFVGYALGLIGNLLKGLAGINDWIADCKPLAIGLASALTGVFLAIKVTKFIELASAMEGTHKFMKLLLDSFMKTSVFKNVIKMVSSLKDTYDRLNSVLKNTSAWQKLSSSISKVVAWLSNGVKSIVEWVKNILISKASNESATIATIALGIAEDATTVKTGVLATALNFLAKNPLVILAIAIGAVIGAIALFNQSQEESSYEMEDYSQHIQDNISDLEDMRTSLEDTSKSARDAFDGKMADIQVIKDYIKLLQEMAGESGYVDNVAKAEFLVEEINSILPDTVELTEDNRIAWLKNADAIQENINKLEQKARLEAYSQLYAESIKAEIEAKQILANAEQELNDMLSERQKLWDKMAQGETVSKEESDRLKQLNADIDGTRKTIDDAKETIKDSTKSIEDNRQAIKDATSSNHDFANSYTGVSDSQAKSFNTLGSDLKNVLGTLKEYHDGTIEMSKEEAKSTEDAKNRLIDSYAESAAMFGTKYEVMLDVLESQGIKLTEKEKQQLEASYKETMKSNEKKLAEFQKHQDTLLTMFEKNHGAIQQEEKDNYVKMLEILNKHGADVNEKNSEIYEGIYDICKKSGMEINTEQGEQYALMLQNLRSHGVLLKAENKDQYKKMFSDAQQYGIDLYGEQGKQYAQFMSELKKHNVDIDSEFGQQYFDQFLKASSAGSEQGKEFLDKLKDGVISDSISPEAQKQWENGNSIFAENPISVCFKVLDPTEAVRTALETIRKKFNNSIINVGLDIAGNVVSAITNPHKYATGGFPSVGQLFIANEAGPELIGNIGSRNAVVNNNQIIAGIQGGVENAVYKAMSAFIGAIQPQSGGLTDVNVNVNLDGDTVYQNQQKVKARKGFDFSGGKGSGKL